MASGVAVQGCGFPVREMDRLLFIRDILMGKQKNPRLRFPHDIFNCLEYDDASAPEFFGINFKIYIHTSVSLFWREDPLLLFFAVLIHHRGFEFQGFFITQGL